MKKNDYSKFANVNGSSIARSTMTQGNYIGRKESEEIRVIGEYEPGKWKEIAEPNTKVSRHLAFATVTDMKNNIPVEVSVPTTFVQLPVKSIFPFKVNGKGYTEVSLQKLTEKQAKQLLSEEV